MPYSVYYPSGCDTQVPDHFCSNCGRKEGARIRSAAYIAKDFEFTDPSNPVEWRQGIAAKKIIIIPLTNGTFDGGSEVEQPGYGDQATELSGYNFVAQYNDPDYALNADFYNAIKRSKNYKFAYRTETQGHITGVAVQAIPKNPVVDDVTGSVVWAVTVKWADEDLPVPFDIPPGIFDCFDYTGVIV